jgi:hypothetical protein
MAHLFLSYAREDRECAELLASALTSRGWSVWWDRRIQVGRSFSEVIEQELEQARCVLVLWSRHSITSEWVQNEAAEAARRKVLVPVRIEDVRPPLEFRRLQAADLFEWRKGFESADFDACLSSIELLVRKTGSRPLPAEVTVEPEEPVVVEKVERPAERPDFFISQDGQQFRAPDIGTLRGWAEEGRVKADSYVYDPALQRWILAREHPALQSAYHRAAVVQQPVVPIVADPVVAEPAATPRTPKPAINYRQPLIALGVVLALFITILSIVLNRPEPEVETTDTVMTETVATTMETTAATAAQPIAVSLENRCTDKSVSVAICYLNTSGKWISKGWYVVQPRETKANVVEAVGPVVYFFGMSGETRWEGRKEDPITYMVPINKTDAFDTPFGELKGEAVSFFGRTVEAGQSAYTQNFTCN